MLMIVPLSSSILILQKTGLGCHHYLVGEFFVSFLVILCFIQRHTDISSQFVDLLVDMKA